MDKRITDAVELLGSLRAGDAVTVTADGRANAMFVSRTLHRSDGAYGSYESNRVTVTYGPGRYAREVTAEQLAYGRVTLARTT